MALKVFVIDDVTGNCDLRQLVPYTNVTSNDGTVVITGTTDPVTGQPSYDLSAAVDVNVNNFSYDPVTKEITLTETDGDSYTINISDLVDVETVTTLVANPDGSFTYTSEDGTVTNIPTVPVLTASLGVERIGNDFQMDIDSLPQGNCLNVGDEYAVNIGGVDHRVPAVSTVFQSEDIIFPAMEPIVPDFDTAGFDALFNYVETIGDNLLSGFTNNGNCPVLLTVHFQSTGWHVRGNTNGEIAFYNNVNYPGLGFRRFDSSTMLTQASLDNVVNGGSFSYSLPLAVGATHIPDVRMTVRYRFGTVSGDSVTTTGEANGMYTAQYTAIPLVR